MQNKTSSSAMQDTTRSSATGLAISLPVDRLRGVGPKMAVRLQSLGIHAVQDLLFHLPARYQDRTRLTPIGQLSDGAEAVIEGEIHQCSVIQGRRRSLQCRFADASGTVTLRFFHFNMAQKAQLSVGTQLRCYGQVRRGGAGLEMYHPEYRNAQEQANAPSDTLTPVYPSCEGITQTLWRKLIAQALAGLADCPAPELLPHSTCDNTRDNPFSLHDALHYLHQPPSDANQQQLANGSHPACQRLALEELVAHNLALVCMRARIQQHQAPSLPPCNALGERFVQSLPFSPTAAQQRVAADIGRDLAHDRPMLRLVQGDVGSGKTLVAAMAALQAVANGVQVAIMAPTELLAQQHLENFQHWFEPLGIQVAWLVGRLQGQARNSQLDAIQSGAATVVIGTHALFQQGVDFHQLGLVIIDEQHRFGVHQRLQLRDKGLQGNGIPHQLVMTATPIPRTLAMTAYADLDCSVIDELPPGRSPVVTVVIANTRRAEVLERVRAACEQGSQVYWVCTLIDESELLQAQAAQATADELREALPEMAVGLVHGRQKAQEKTLAMGAFKAGEVQLLVATTVIEVGVDVPNASLMIIENPERLGLAQLHQLRGRVGRGPRQSHCVLLYQNPLSNAGKARLQAMRDSNDGFVIAERDLELRGPGEVLGTRQTGLVNLRIADLMRDEHLIASARQLAEQISSEDSARATALMARWIGQGETYAQV
jgi:ATP-dependent DNA helicase RecG